MENSTVLVSGASIAGPALAFWLSRYGFEVTVVEKAPGLRPGGQAVDFKGPVHRTVLSRMGILDEVERASVADADGAIVNARGRRVGTVPGAFSGGEINIPRGDLAGILHRLTESTCDYVFGDSVASLTETPTGVDVTFEHGEARTFDLVVGADGIHSRVRSLAMGPESDYVTHLGYCYALADLGIDSGDVVYNEPGRMVGLGGPKAPAFFVFASEPPATRDDVPAQKRWLAEAYRDGGWRLPEVVDAIPGSRDFYLDSISRVTAEHYSRGRVVLVGDSAYGNALGGFGTGLAVVGAYVLADELHRAGGDHAVAFARYEERFRDYASVSRKVNAGRLLAPRSRLGIAGRNVLFTALGLFSPLMRAFDSPARGIDLDAS